MTRIGKLLIFIFVLILLAAMGYEAQNVAKMGWNAFVEYKSPYLAQLPRVGSTEPLAKRVVLIVVDGLRLDASKKMPTLNELRKQGADLVVRVGQPSLSYPGWTVISSGAWQEISGVTTNWYEGEVQVDSIFKVAKDSGLPSIVVGSPGWKKLFNTHITEALTVEEPEEETSPEGWTKVDEETYRLALKALEKYDTGFILIHFIGTDSLAHIFGGVSEEYLAEALRVDGHIRELLNLMDLDEDVLIVTSDHGHIDAGGHGGWEEEVLRVPLVMVGKAIRQGVYTEKPQVDIAPTVAALLGLPSPAHSQGRPLLEMIEAPAEVKGRKGLNAALQLVGFYDAYSKALGGRTFAGDVLKKYRENIAIGEEGALANFHADLTRRASAARMARLWRERLVRFPIALAIALFPLLYLLLYRKRIRQAAIPLVFALLYFVIYNSIFFILRGHRWSFSAFNSEAQIKVFFNQCLMDAAFSMLITGLILALISWKKTWMETLERVVTFSFFTGYFLLIQVDFFYWLYNIKISWYLPDLKLGFKYYLDLLQMTPVGFLSLILPPLALAINWGIKRWRMAPAPIPQAIPTSQVSPEEAPRPEESPDMAEKKPEEVE
ncbi:MAG: hypothetical protein DRI61_12850 [Chloroflexi bacterium]|nr:MAG: hypothetical protein DRI61_12850 [Chloroflexota bacterium]